MLDRYFKRPLFWDYILASVLSGVMIVLFRKNYISLPKDEFALSITSDLATIALTLAGFILTLLTILITFKSGSKISKTNYDDENETVFDLFFASELYFETIKHLKGCVKSLVFVAVFGFSLKLGLTQTYYKYLFFFNVFGLAIIVVTLWRSLLILGKIIKMQKND